MGEKDPIGQLRLPAGFRFYPTDEELLVHYLCRKVAGHEFSIQIIADIDLYKFDPWVLPGKAVFGEKEWYFFSPRDRKYPNGSRPNRVAGCGYWKATGTDKLITSRGRKVGIKKALVFYMGRAPYGTKTNWIMHEYRLFDSPRSTCSSKLDDWVLCRIYKKNSSANSTSANEHSAGGSSTSSATSLETSPARSNQQKLVLENYGSVNLDWGELARLTAGPEFGVSGPLNQGGHVINNGSGTCVSSMLCHVGTPQPQEKLIERAPGGFFNKSPNMYPNLADPFGLKYPAPNPVAAFGFRH